MKSTNINNTIKKVRELFNEIRSNLSREETNRIRKKLYKKEAAYNFLKEKYSSRNKQKIVLNSISMYLKKLNNNSKKLHNYQNNITYGLNYLFNDVNENDCYKPQEIKSALDGSYIVYESKGDKDAKLELWEYFNKIIPYLRVMIDYHKAEGEWKIQLIS